MKLARDRPANLLDDNRGGPDHACTCSRTAAILYAVPEALGREMLERLEKYSDDGVFDPDAVRILTAAFDEAWQSVQHSGVIFTSQAHINATREILALRIIEMAQCGEREQCRLRDDALLYLSRSNAKSSGL